MYTDKAKKTDDGRECKLVPNIHPSLLLQPQKLHMLAGYLAAGPKDDFLTAIEAIMAAGLCSGRESTYMEEAGAFAEYRP